MNTNFYLPRKLLSNDGLHTESSLLTASNHIIILAEPGAGKTELLKSLARQLGTVAITANFFGHTGITKENSPLVIDAFDELSKVDQTGIHKLLTHARNRNPTHLIISSRSSEWDNSATDAFYEFLGREPLVVKLCEFTDSEQSLIFENHVAGENFLNFRNEVSKFNLEALLPNPQFLKLFANAYIESERSFTDKRSIFAQAVERLAKEANSTVSRGSIILSVTQKIDLSSEIFAKLLLSGAEGISTFEATESRMYPLLTSLINKENAVSAHGILATQLFKPGDSANLHRPVHKIVAEYCAAQYLIGRIMDPVDPLSLPTCLSVIAPSSIVRDELRGLLGWMAALGDKTIEENAIALDPYAVLTNGDPSQLEHSSKLLLIHQLRIIEKKDPYFRRGDFWRRYSVAGFFNKEILSEMKPLLESSNDGQLRDLIIEVLTGSPVVDQLKEPLRKILLAHSENKNTRLLAARCLLSSPHCITPQDLKVLIKEKSETSLEISTSFIEYLKPEGLDQETTTNFFRSCADLYPSHKNLSEHLTFSNHFIKRAIHQLSLSTTTAILDNLVQDIACKCGRGSYGCNCLSGISKVTGLLLDHYFHLATQPLDPSQIWLWIKNLRFREGKSPRQSKSVSTLQEDDKLRQSIIAQALRNLTDKDEIHSKKLYNLNFHSHSGLKLQPKDSEFLANLAFEADNINLWGSLIPQHTPQSKDEHTSCLRRHMRKQAFSKPNFLKKWTEINTETQEISKKSQLHNSKLIRRMRRYQKREEEKKTYNLKLISDNRSSIESGRNWSFLALSSELILLAPEKIESEIGDEKLAYNSLLNCLDFITPEVPNLSDLAQLRCESKWSHSEAILYAACLVRLRITKNLNSVNPYLLISLRANIYANYTAISLDERNKLRAEIDRIIFPNKIDPENFIREYIEPQFSHPNFTHPELWLISDDKSFKHLRADLSIDWLRRFPDMQTESLDILFEIAARHKKYNELKEIIKTQQTALKSAHKKQNHHQDSARRRSFWLLRAWFFLEEIPREDWKEFISDKTTALLIYERSGRVFYRNHSHWPTLTSIKIEEILNAYIEQWPKVELPSHWGSESPSNELAYRFLKDVIWLINSDTPEIAIPVLERLLADARFADLHNDLKNIQATQLRKYALINFEAPPPQEIAHLLDRDTVITVEGLRSLILQELQVFQKSIWGGEYNSGDRFYEKGERLNEEACTEIIAERLSLRLQPKSITITPEHTLKSRKRSDFTAAKIINNKRRLLVIEVKGQWHRDLYKAASSQLNERYSIHPDAEQQGIYVAIWFGRHEKVANRKQHTIATAEELRISIENAMPPELSGRIDIFVLDVSKTSR